LISVDKGPVDYHADWDDGMSVEWDMNNAYDDHAYDLFLFFSFLFFHLMPSDSPLWWPWYLPCTVVRDTLLFYCICQQQTCM
jgi:hypothetical protein